MSTLRIILADQLTISLPIVKNAQQDDVFLLMEVRAETTYVKHHKQKIAYLFSAMRHFAAELAEKGHTVRYIKLLDEGNTHNFADEIKRACANQEFDKILITEPGEYRVLEQLKQLQSELDIPLNILEDTRFFCSIDTFKEWASSRKSLRMEYFYREMRKEHGYLLEDDKKPVGGDWNFDAKNRNRYDGKSSIPERPTFAVDEITQAVFDLVVEEFQDHFGDLNPSRFPVTRAQAKEALDYFLNHCLKNFGKYQDAMVTDEAFLFHSLLSPAINCGLLTPAEVCDAAEAAYYNNNAPIEAVEGFIRQILGWREYVRGIYWLNMPEYAEENRLNATRPLPEFYWTGDTDMKCMREAITQTKENAYAHHIQRLMVTGNFALLAGLDVKEVCDWYLAVYADAYEWVELPNTLGMALYADGGYLASKPYASSGAYINKMSDYCKNCKYSVTAKNGESACPFNYLYWDFLMRNEDKLKGNPRLSMPYNTLSKFSDEKKELIKDDAQRFLNKLSA